MSKKSKAGGSCPATNVDPDTLIARATAHRWQRRCEAEKVALDPGSKRRARRVYDAVRGLAKSGRISGRAHGRGGQVDTRLRVEHAVVLRRSCAASIRGGGGNAGPELRLAAGVDASTKYREAALAVGLVGERSAAGRPG